jgi:type I restriction enzyme S subunit
MQKAFESVEIAICEASERRGDRMSWDTIRFGDLYAEDSRNGLTKPSKVRGSGYKMINMGELFSNDRIFDIPMELVPLKENEKKNAKVEKGDLLFARQSLVLEGAGKCCIVMDVSPLTVFESHLIRVRLDNTKANPLFYYYYFKSPLSPMSTIVSQCAQAGIRGSDLQELDVSIPPLPVQNRIANVLEKYDELIENNQKQIKLLEEAAQRLYKDWFVDLHFPGYENCKIVDGVPEGWTVRSMENIADYLNGYAFKPSDWGEIGKPIIKIKELNCGITKDTPRNTGDDIPEKYRVFPGDIVFSWSATLTAKIWDEEEGLLNQHLFSVC